MTLNEVQFNGQVQDKNGGTFEFRYEGIENDSNIDTDKVQELISKFMNQIIYHGNMVRNVSFLRTILKDYNEKLLVLSYQDNEIKENVKFDNSHMFLFEKSEFDDGLMVKYTPKDNISFMFTDCENNKINYSNIENISDRITKVLREIDSLNRTKFIELNQDSKLIIEIYKLFYNENPDFSDNNINIKMQTMMFILSEFGIVANDSYGFSLYGKKKIPMSLSLSNLIYELFPLGEIKDIDNPFELANDRKRIITIVGENIRNIINDIDNKEEILITISKVIYAIRYGISASADTNDIAKYTNCPKNEVESSIKLVKKIDNRILYKS